ncbi:MAG: multi-sensor hybrid histidine kinase [bacterium]|nr:MAG: multi-sensor hybrid histidine kinase [bacterium]KAF0149756.1 MAG: multi-sensor hybrid histidine kinase [bacterium]KAF0167196.1 MAG: multi-sensor hybrid histidine kinase [bacterium]TXT19352.1 MAG: multi-sensor hybrid histidine kinase [bacterium]
MHRLLERQLKRVLGLDAGQWPRLADKLRDWADRVADEDAELARGLFGLPQLLERVSESYVQQDRDLTLLRRSLELSSAELSTANERLRREAKAMSQALVALQWTFDALRHDAEGETEALDGDLVGMAEQIALLTQEQERMRAALAKSEERFDLAMRGANDGLWDYDLARGKVYYSPRWKEMIGYAPGEIGDGLEEWSGRLHPDDTAKALAAVEAHANGESDHLETVFRFRHRDGHYLWMLARGLAVRDASGRAVRMVGTHTDITERVELEHYLAQFKRALDEHAIVSITDAQGNITYANQRFCDISGYSREELLGRNHRLLKSGAHDEEFYRDLWSTISGGETWVGEICNRAKDGRLYWVLATISPMLGEDGLPSQFIAIRADISRIKDAESALVKAKENAENANRAKSEFLANMSHEIRTPMNGVLGMLALTLESPLTAEQREYLELARTSADSLLHIINDILDFSKIEAGYLDIHEEAVELRALLDELGRLHGARCREKGLEFAVEVDATLPATLLLDPVRMRQVLNNLLGNAIKFTASGGVTLSAKRLGYGMRIAVRDTGIGIPRDKQAKVFEAFAQADGSITRRFGGTGLGLSITSRLVRLMGGLIGVESEPDVGSEFYFLLPISEPKAAERVTSADGAPESMERRALRILLAEDNLINQKLAVTLLSREGHRVEVVADGLAAVKAAQAASFDVVLMDMQMPELDGVGAARAIRAAEPLGARLPIIALTANAFDEDRDACLAAGMDGFLSKPIKREALLAAIDQALAGSAVPPAI